MTKLKVGDVGYMKTTGEPGLILGIYEQTNGSIAKELGPVVRIRLTGGAPNHPLTYPVQEFYLAELETLEEKTARDYQEGHTVNTLLKSFQTVQPAEAIKKSMEN